MFGSAPRLSSSAATLVVGVDDGDDERRGAIRIDQVQVGAERRERLDRLERVLPRRVHQRRPAAEREDRLAGAPTRNLEERRAGVDVCAALDQHLDGVGVVLRRGPHQRASRRTSSRARSRPRRVEAGPSARRACPCVPPSSGPFRPPAARRSDSAPPRAEAPSTARLPLIAASASGVTP